MRTATAATVLCLTFLVRPLIAEELPTAEELKALADQKQWQELLQATSRVLAVKTGKGAEYDRVAVWCMKAEAQMQTAQFIPAADSFEKSAAESKAAPEQVDWGIAMSQVARKSDKRGYRPDATKEDPNPKTYDILKETERKDAIAAIFDVQASALAKRFEKIKAVLPPKPTVDLIKDTVESQHLERAGIGNTDRTDKMLEEVGTAFTDGATKWSDTTVARCGEISKTANEMIQDTERVTERVNGRDRVTERVRLRKRGLTGNDSKELKDLMAAAEKLADNYKQIEKALPEKSRTTIVPAKAAVQRAYDEAEKVLKADYRIPRN